MKHKIHTTVVLSAMLMLAVPAMAADDHKGHDHAGDKKSASHAHESKPMYGGVVAEVKDINYELVAKPESLVLYVTDHGKPVDIKGGTATLTLLNASDKSDVTLAPAADNRFEAKGTYKVAPGTKAVARITLPGKPAQNVRFTLK